MCMAIYLRILQLDQTIQCWNACCYSLCTWKHVFVTSGADLTESDDESDDDISGPNRTMGKRRKLGGPKIEATLANILEHNSQTVVEAMMELEERQDKRHREDLELEKRKLAMEKENFSHMMKLSTGYISALNSIGDGLKQLSAVLTGNAHSLHFPQAL